MASSLLLKHCDKKRSNVCHIITGDVFVSHIWCMISLHQIHHGKSCWNCIVHYNYNWISVLFVNIVEVVISYLLFPFQKQCPSMISNENTNAMVNLFHFNSVPDHEITTTFYTCHNSCAVEAYTCHNSCAVEACAKFGSIHVIIIENRTHSLWNFNCEGAIVAWFPTPCCWWGFCWGV